MIPDSILIINFSFDVRKRIMYFNCQSLGIQKAALGEGGLDSSLLDSSWSAWWDELIWELIFFDLDLIVLKNLFRGFSTDMDDKEFVQFAHRGLNIKIWRYKIFVILIRFYYRLFRRCWHCQSSLCRQFLRSQYFHLPLKYCQGFALFPSRIQLAAHSLLRFESLDKH